MCCQRPTHHGLFSCGLQHQTAARDFDDRQRKIRRAPHAAAVPVRAADARHRPIPIRRPLPKQISHETKHWRQFITFPDSKNKNKSSANFKTKFQFVKSKKLTLPLRLELHVQQSSHQLSATFSKCKLLFEKHLAVSKGSHHFKDFQQLKQFQSTLQLQA
jgi:hypothetical protein